jgi:thioesterase domain-containing protein
VKGSIPIRTIGAQRPLFLIHDNTGQDLWFPLLAERINPDIPVYGLPAVPMDEPQLQTIEGMAARLVAIMRTVQPEGPYRFAGWSLGGILAYEVSVQLIGQNQAVEFAGLLDTYCPIMRRGPNFALALRPLKKSAQIRLTDLCEELEREVPLTIDQRQALHGLKDVASETDFEDLFSQCRELGLFPESLVGHSASVIQKYLVRLLAHEHAVANYVVQPIPIPIYLFAAEEQPAVQEEQGPPDPLLGWGGVLPEQQIQLIRVTGNHRSLMEDPHVAVLGQALSASIADASRQQLLTPEMQYSATVVLQTGNRSQTPFFCVPGAGDNVIGFISLSGALGQDCPVYGLQPRGVEGGLVPHSTIEAAAAVYLREIEAIRPDGHVHLIGHSFGGWVAFEVASRIYDSGRSVASLTVVDSEVPGGSGILGREYTSTEVFRELIQVIELASGASLGIDPAEFEAEDDDGQLRLLHEGALRVGLMPRRSPPSVFSGTRRTFGSALRTRYQPHRPYPNPLRLVLANDPRLDDQANQREHEKILEGWRLWAPLIACWQGPGNHFTILKPPHVQILADWWRNGLCPQD